MNHGEDLDRLVGYQVQRAHLLMEGDARRALSRHQISPAKLTALILVRDNPGCDQTALGRALSINRSSAMKLVNVLVDRGLVERRSGRDLRSNALHLTAEGDARIAAMLNDLRLSDERMTTRMTAQEIRTLGKLLRKLNATNVTQSDEQGEAA